MSINRIGILNFEFGPPTTFVISINGTAILTFNLDFQLFGPQILIQQPKKPHNSEFHRHFSICSVFRNFSSHMESEILSFVLLTISL